MHVSTKALIGQFDTAYAALLGVIDRVPPEHHARRSEPDAWSASGVVHHLAIVERRIAARWSPALDAVRAQGTTASGAEPAASTLDRDRLTDRRTKIKTGEASQPRPDINMAAARDELSAAHAALRAMIVAADGLSVGHLSMPHPALGPLSFADWVVFAAAHEARHANQIEEIVAASA
jgi:hypothetical protein